MKVAFLGISLLFAAAAGAWVLTGCMARAEGDRDSYMWFLGGAIVSLLAISCVVTAEVAA